MENMRYDEQDMRAIVSTGVLNNDAEDSESVFFAQQLEYIKSKTYDEKLANLNAAKLFPVSTEADAGAESISYESYGMVGIAKLIASYADDLPRADVKGTKVTVDIFSAGTSYGYSTQDIRAAKMKGLPLNARRALSARRANDTLINKIAFKGDKDGKIVGILDNPNITTAVVKADGTSNSTKWADKTPAQILRDLNDAVSGIVDLTNGVEIPDTVVLPIKQYNYIANTIVPDTSGESILTNFKKNNQYIKNVVSAVEMKGAGSGGEDVGLIYRKDIDAVSLEIPMAFTQYAPQARNLEFVIPCESRTAGVIVYYPLSMSKMVGI